EIGRVEHQLQRHIHHQQVAPRDDAEQSQAKQQGADDQIMFQAGVHNWKSETRNPNSERSPKSEFRMAAAKAACFRQPLRASSFGFLSGFVIRISDFTSGLSCSTKSRPSSPRAAARRRLRMAAGIV